MKPARRILSILIPELNVRRICFLVLIPILLLTASGRRVDARDRVGIEIGPVIFEYEEKPGAELVGQILLFNPLESEEQVTLKSWDFVPADEHGRLRFFEGQSNRSASDWISYTVPERALVSQEQVVVPFTIRIPRSARPGTYTGVVFAETGMDVADNQSGSAVNVAAGSLFLVDVITDRPHEPKPPEILDIQILGTRPIIGQIRWVDTGGRPIRVRYRNNDIFQERPVVELEITDIWGRTQPIGQVNRRVLPGSVIQFPFEWSPRFVLGRYRVLVQASYGDVANNQVAETETLWAVNAIGLYSIGFVVVVVIALLVSRMRQ